MKNNSKANKANSNRSMHIDASNWFNWQIRDFQYQVDVYKKSGQLQKSPDPDEKSQSSESPKP